MKEFSAYIDYCAKQFNAIGKCQVCPYGQCIHDFPDGNGLNCYSCLTKIHKYYNKDKKYQCQRIIYNYVLVHGHRYTSEIDKILALLKGCVQFPLELNVFSIGSGPCTELFSVYNQFTDHNIHFRGFDLNQIWEPISQFEQSLFPDKDIQFLYANFFDYIAENDCHIDLLILNYMLSDMARCEPPFVCSSFIDRIVNLCENQKISNIIINDIYLTYAQRTGYALMEELARKLQANKSIIVRVGRGHFMLPNEYQPTYGRKYADNLTFLINEQSVKPFSPMEECRSIFMLVNFN